MRTKLPLLVVLGITLVSVPSLNAQSFLTNGLVAYYPFNGNANDASGNGYHLQNNGATYGTNSLGVPNSAASFNSGSSRPPVGNGGNSFGGQWMSFATARPLSGLTNVTIAVWLRPDNFYPETFGNAASQWILFQEGVVQVGLANHGQEVFGFVIGNGSVGGWDLPAVGIYNNTFGFSTNGSWVHCVYTANGDGQKLFLNGTLASSTTNGISAVGANGYLLGLGAYFNGGMDNLRFYRRALSSNEVASLYYLESKKNVQFVKMYTLDFDGLYLGTNYQLQVSTNVLTWTNWGSPFTATSVKYTNAIPIQRVDDWGKIFFRLVPQ